MKRLKFLSSKTSFLLKMRLTLGLAALFLVLVFLYLILKDKRAQMIASVYFLRLKDKLNVILEKDEKFLISELGVMTFAQKKGLNPNQEISDELLDKLIIKNRKKFILNRIYIFSICILLIGLQGYMYFSDKINPGFMTFSMTCIAFFGFLTMNKEVVDSSKKDMIYRLLKKNK